MPDETNSDNDRVGRAFKLHLDREGYSFHYTALRRCEQLASQLSDHRLQFEVSEFPVQVQGRDTRIDFILKITSKWTSVIPGERSQPGLWLSCESKRSNPAFADWCFARAPYVTPHGTPRVIVDRLTVDGTGNTLCAAVTLRAAEQPYHVGLPVKSEETGDSASKGNAREAIEEAAGQVMRGLNGLANFLFTKPKMLEGQSILLVPAIFTTAALYTSDVDLAGAVLETGTLDMPNVDVQRRDWIWYQSHVSSSLRHSIRRELADAVGSLGEVLDVEYSRSIAIVSVTGIEPFLRSIGHIAESVYDLQ